MTRGLCLLTLAASLGAGFGTGCTKSSTKLHPPQQIHLSWQGAPTHRSISVVWRSSLRQSAIRYGLGAKLGPKIEAHSISYANSYLHRVTLENLTPSRRYRYRVGHGRSWSEPLTFETAPAPESSQSISFVAMGDSRSNDVVRRNIGRAVAQEKPLFILHTGDLVASGTRQREWDRFFSTMQGLLARCAFMPALGNHEHNASQYFSQFRLPKHAPRNAAYAAEAYYSFDVGYLHLITLSTEPAGKVNGPQYRWLEADLARAKTNPHLRWIIVQAHRPPYSTGPHGDNVKSQHWVPLFEKYGVDLTFWGHDHIYERTKPLLGGQPVKSGGITYIVTGGAGAKLYEGKGNHRTASIHSKHHFVLVRATREKLIIEAKDSANGVFDRFVIEK